MERHHPAAGARDAELCAFCGAGFWGRRKALYRLVPPAAGSPAPYAVANVFVHDRTKVGDRWVACPECAQHPQRRLGRLVIMPPGYVQRLLGCDGEHAQLLSLLDVNLEIRNRYKGFATGVRHERSLLDAPLLSWGDRQHAIPYAVQEMLALLLQHNPYVKQYLTMLEVPHPQHRVPVLPSSVVSSIVRDVQLRNPVRGMGAAAAPAGAAAPASIFFDTPCPARATAAQVQLLLELVGRAGGERRSVLREAERLHEGLHPGRPPRRPRQGSALRMIRLELQRPGSVHAHITLCVDPAGVLLLGPAAPGQAAATVTAPSAPLASRPLCFA